MDEKLNETVNNNEEEHTIDLEKKDTEPEKNEETSEAPVTNDSVTGSAEEKQESDIKEEPKPEEKPESAPKQESASGSKLNNTNMKKAIQYQTVDPAAKNNAEPEKKKGSLVKKIAIGAAAVFVLYILFAAVFSIGQKYERPVKYYYKAIEKGDGKYLEKAFGSIVEEELDEILKDNKGKNKKYKDIDSASDVYTASAVMMHKDYMESYGTGFKIKVEVTGKEKIKKADLKKVNKKLKDKKIDHKVKKGYYLRTSITLDSKEDREIEKKDLVEVFLIDNEWVFFDDSYLSSDSLGAMEGILLTHDKF